MKRRIRWIAGLVILLVLIAGARGAYHVHQRLRAKETAGRVRTLSVILLTERPPSVHRDILIALTTKYRRQEVLRDAWGHPLEVRVEQGRYVVISRARDGRDSGCCVAAQDATYDTDLLAIDGAWRQIWY